MISAGKGASPAKPNQPKVSVGKLTTPAPPPSSPFGGKMQSQPNRAAMAGELLNQSGQQPNVAQQQNQDYLRRMNGGM